MKILWNNQHLIKLTHFTKYAKIMHVKNEKTRISLYKNRSLILVLRKLV